MSLTVSIQSRAFSDELQTLPVQFKVGPYSWSVFGGPKAAEIQVEGAENDLWEMIERLRCPITIWSENGDAVWWGFIAEVELQLPAWTVGVNIDSMYNRIAVAYTTAADNGETGARETTSWLEDADSVAEYGRKELLYTSSGSSLAHAEAARAMLLAQKKFPIPTIERADNGKIGVTLRCRGWYNTLNWRYYAESAGLEMYSTSGPGDQAVGAAAANERIGQGFQLSKPWTVKTIEINIKAVGSITDNVDVQICADASGAPGTVLGSGTITGSTVPVDYVWMVINLTTPVNLDAATPYWLVVKRSGALDAVNYFVLEVNEDLGYTPGALRLYTGAAWVARVPDADLNFKLSSTEDTAIQIKNIVTAAGEFITAVDLDCYSGLPISQFRDGDGLALYEVEEMLKMGTANFRRMLATVDINRRMRIYEEPTNDNPYLISKKGELRDALDNPVRAEQCPVGIYARLKDVIPGSLDTSKLADPSLMFIDEAEYTPDTGKLMVQPRGMESPWDIGRPIDG